MSNNRRKRRAAERRPVQTINAPSWQIEETEPGRARMTIGVRAIPIEQIRAEELKAEHDLRQALRQLNKAQQVTSLDVVINCRGGSTAIANGIMRGLDRWNGAKRCLIDGACSSAATLIAFGPEWEVAITPASHVQIHKPVTQQWSRHGTGIWQMLVKPQMTATIALMRSVYSNRSGRPEDETAQWIEKGKYALGFASCLTETFMLAADGGLWALRTAEYAKNTFMEGSQYTWIGPDGAFEAREETDGEVPWLLRTGEIMARLPNNKRIGKIQIQTELPAGTSLTVRVKKDNEDWETVFQAEERDERRYTLPIYPRRCDRLMIEMTGTGPVKIYNLSWLIEGGSEYGRA